MKKTDLQAYSESVRSEVFRHMSLWLEEKTRGTPPRLKSCLLEYHRRKGKKLRAVFLRLFSDGLGGDAAKASRVAAACEILENWGLGRDDLADHALLRRGKPSLPVIYGEEMAMNSLDLLQTYAAEMFYSYCCLSPKEYGKVFLQVCDSVRKSMTGQHLELEARERPLSEFSEKKYFRIAALKTASYTTVGTARLGALLSAREDLFVSIDRFGLHLGAAFQLIDDVLDAEQDGSGAFGKSVGNDIKEGKRTLLAFKAFKRAGPAERKRLERIYSRGEGKPSRADVAWARSLFFSTGALDDCRKKALSLSELAVSEFTRSLYPEMRNPYGGLLLDFIAMLKARAA